MASQKLGGVKQFFARIGKRNIIIICSVLLIGLAVYLNYLWFYNPTNVNYGEGNAVGAGTGTSENDGQSTGGKTSVSDYFTSTELSRKQARDEALEVLQSVVSSETATAATKDKALEDMSKIAVDIQNESAIETLVIAKGFEDCVAVINDGSVSIVVKSDGLLASQLAQINEIVYEQTGILPANINIIARSGS